MLIHPMASTLRPINHPGGPPVPAAGMLASLSGLEVAAWLNSSSALEASVGMAAFNAHLEMREETGIEVNAEDVILEHGSGRRVAIVGHFPIVERVRQAASECWVVELRPRPGDLPADQAFRGLSQADVVALTGTSLINHTFDDLIQLCRPDAFVIVLGGSTPLSPILFEYGVDAVAGTQVVDVPLVLQTVSQGATFRQIKG